MGACLLLAWGAFAAPESDTDAALETVLVLGQQIQLQLEAEQSLTPGGVSLIDGNTLYQRNVSSLADMLRYVPGVWAASNSGTDSMFFSSRGSNLDATHYDMNGIKLLQDGLPVTTADGNNHNRIIDPMSARYASVARGANALTYGASTLGGAIDFVTPTARNSPPMEVFLSGGSHGQLQGRVTAGTVVDDFDGQITLEAKEWDGYRDHNRQQRRGLYSNAGWQINDTLHTRLYFNYVDNEQELPGALSRQQLRADRDQASPQAIGGHYQVNVETWRIASKTRWEIDDRSSLDIGFSYEEQSLFHPIVIGFLLVDTDHKNIGAMLRYQLRWGDHDLVAGLNYGDSRIDGGNYRNNHGRRNGLRGRIDNQADSLEAYLVDRWRFADQWTLVYGAQAVLASRDVRNTTVATGELRNPKDDYSSINPRLGVIYAVNDDIDLFANISRLYEAPTSYELEDDIRGNSATLDAMHGTVLEIGSRGRRSLGAASHWNWDVAVYYAELRDEILSIDDPTAPGTSLSTNIDETVHAGIEALFSASFALDSDGQHRLEPLASVTVNHFVFDDDPVYRNRDLPAAPGYVVKGELLYRHANGFYVGPTFDIVDRRYADFYNTYKIDSYALLGLRAGVTGPHWEVFMELRNALDRDHVATHSVMDRAAPDAAILNPGEPRSLYAGVRLQF